MDDDTAARLSLSDRFSRAAQWISQQSVRSPLANHLHRDSGSFMIRSDF
jgi:hypothetical protein